MGLELAHHSILLNFLQTLTFVSRLLSNPEVSEEVSEVRGNVCAKLVVVARIAATKVAMHVDVH
jgi:hypothetical protein